MNTLQTLYLPRLLGDPSNYLSHVDSLFFSIPSFGGHCQKLLVYFTLALRTLRTLTGLNDLHQPCLEPLPQSLHEGPGATFRHSPEPSVLAQAMLQEYCLTTAVAAHWPWSDLPVWLCIYSLTRELPGNHWTIYCQESWTWPWLMDWLLDLTLALSHHCELTGWSRLMVESSRCLGFVCFPWLGTKLLVPGSVSSSAAGTLPFGSSWHFLLTAGTALLVWSCSQFLQKFRKSKIWWQWNWRQTWKKILRNNSELWLSHQSCCKTNALSCVTYFACNVLLGWCSEFCWLP